MKWSDEYRAHVVGSMADLAAGKVLSWTVTDDGRRRVVFNYLSAGESTVVAVSLPPEDMFGEWPALDPALHGLSWGETDWETPVEELRGLQEAGRVRCV